MSEKLVHLQPTICIQQTLPIMTSFQLQECFEVIALCVASIYLTICICIGFFKAPKDELYRPYRQSKRMLTAALASMAINLIIWRILTTGDWSKFNYGIAILDVVLFYFEELMMCYSFCHILNNSFLTRRRITKDVTHILVATVLVLLPLIPGLQHLTLYFFLAALIIMVVNISELAFLFRKQYKLNGEMLDNYFSNDMHYFVRWTSRSITLLIISWVFAVVTLFTNVYVNLVFQAYMVTLNFYIAINFTNFCTKYGDIARAYLPAGEDPEDIIIKPKETDSQTIEVQTLEQRINTWMEAKEYVGSQFTIDELATKLGTNKGYLSFFINEHFGTNFSVWVSGLRINEAKQLMTANPERKMEDIAYTVGFSSPSYFSKVFASHEGMSPTVWRREVMSK